MIKPLRPGGRALFGGLVALPLVLSTAALSACAGAPTGSSDGLQDATRDAPTNVILLIADGAGLAHWTLAAYAEDGLAVSRMKAVGLVDTRGADHTVSGSAPTATAYATGVRARMGYVGVDEDGQPRTSVLEAAMAQGKSTGLVTTTSIVDATPAAFGGHNTRRYASGALAREMSTKGITLLMGGGRSAFRPQAQPDGRDLLAELRQRYTYVHDVEDLVSLDTDSLDNLLGLFAEGAMDVVDERGMALQHMTGTALNLLSRNPDGFFLLVENEESDTQAHRNADRDVITAEMLDFDRAVGMALDFRRDHPGTLVVVTSDHETGGISLTYDDDREIVMQYASGSHTGVLVPLFADGPGADRFTGIIRNDEVGRILLEMMGAEPPPAPR